jgi:hypothetical protein
MDLYKIYTNTGNHVARGSLLSDTVIIKILTTVSGGVFALGWLIPGTNCTENREGFLHIVAQETINLNVTLVNLNVMRHRMRIPILKVIFC